MIRTPKRTAPGRDAEFKFLHQINLKVSFEEVRTKFNDHYILKPQIRQDALLDI